MYSCLPGLVIGFHGCDRNIAEDVFSGKIRLHPSCNNYDWLGHGIYFWEFNLKRALDYAAFLKKNPRRTRISIAEPCALGAIIDLGHCLNLVDAESLEIVKKGYQLLDISTQISRTPMPKNEKPLHEETDLLIRKLDCAVIETIHAFNDEQKKKPYDSVRGVFWEGKDLYPNAGFKEKNHIQICIRNPNCIKGYFRPLLVQSDYPLP